MTYLEGNVGSFRPRGSDCAVNILRWVLVTVLTQVEDQAEDEELGTTRARRRWLAGSGVAGPSRSRVSLSRARRG